MLRQLLCLLCLSVTHEARTNSVHEVSISVSSVKSIFYRGIQVSIFEDTQMRRRYFFQPLSFLDGKSARLTSNTDLNVTQLHFDVYLWTDEFIQLVESHFVNHISVEMLPLTEIGLSWSKQASVWLGENYTQTYRLLEDWKDADKPHMRNTFTIFCEKLEECTKLQKKFNESSEAVGHLFDLRYKIQRDSTRKIKLIVRHSDFLQSRAFQELNEFTTLAKDPRVIVFDQMVNKVADQVYTAALGELEREAKQQFTYIDEESHKAVLTKLHWYLRTDRVNSLLSKLQWDSQVFWPIGRLNLRPDKLSYIFNKLFPPASEPLMITMPNVSQLDEAGESLPKPEFEKIKAFVVLHEEHKSPSVQVDEVQNLASHLGSYVAWNHSARAFAPPASLTLFRLNLLDISKQGILMMRDLSVNFKVSEHTDPVHPLPKGMEFQSSVWQRHFAESFCILANRGEPPGMECRVLSYRLPTKSLQHDFGNFIDAFRPRVSYKGGHIGQSHFYQMNSGEFSFSLKICCTKDPKNQ